MYKIQIASTLLISSRNTFVYLKNDVSIQSQLFYLSSNQSNIRFEFPSWISIKKLRICDRIWKNINNKINFFSFRSWKSPMHNKISTWRNISQFGQYYLNSIKTIYTIKLLDIMIWPQWRLMSRVTPLTINAILSRWWDDIMI